MVNPVNIVDEFAEDGVVVFDFLAKDRQDNQLPNPETATGSFVVTDWRVGAVVFECKVSPEFVLIDQPTAKFQVKPDAAKLALLTPGLTYQYDIWTVTSQEGRLHQLNGLFRLYEANKET